MTTQPLRAGCEPACPACPHRQWAMEASLEQKKEFLASKLAPWRAVLGDVRSVADSGRWGYRFKVKLAARWMNYHWQFGLEPRDDFIAIPDCPVHAVGVNEVCRILGEVLPPPEIFPLRYYVQTGALATLVLKTANLPDSEWLGPETQRALAAAGVAGLHVNLHPAAGRILFSKNGWQRLWGEERARDSAGLWYLPGAFQQLLPVLYGESLDVAAAFLDAGPGDGVIDLYCGIGAGMSRWLTRTRRVIGVEADGRALECAGLNAPSAVLLRGLCAQRLPQLRQWHASLESDAGRFVYANPPRAGIEPEVLRWLVESCRPSRMAYLSCSAGTLARDLAELEKAGWRVDALIPFDFFPQTIHVETLALISLNR